MPMPTAATAPNIRPTAMTSERLGRRMTHSSQREYLMRR
jgi:hypothetical protein